MEIKKLSPEEVAVRENALQAINARARDLFFTADAVRIIEHLYASLDVAELTDLTKRINTAFPKMSESYVNARAMVIHKEVRESFEHDLDVWPYVMTLPYHRDVPKNAAAETSTTISCNKASKAGKKDNKPKQGRTGSKAASSPYVDSKHLREGPVYEGLWSRVQDLSPTEKSAFTLECLVAPKAAPNLISPEDRARHLGMPLQPYYEAVSRARRKLREGGELTADMRAIVGVGRGDIILGGKHKPR